MRRKEKQITDQALLESILQEAQVCRIGMAQDNTPYVVPVSFGYRKGCLYFHSAPAGKKIEILRQNNSVCFEMDIRTELVTSDRPCNWTMKYCSVMGTGRAVFLEDEQEKRQALDVIMEHYGAASTEYPHEIIDKIAIIRIEVQSMTGKKSGY